MLPSKPKSGIFEASITKNTKEPPKASKVSTTRCTKPANGSTSPMAKQASPIPKPRFSADRLLKTVDPKTTNKKSTNPDKQPQTTMALGLKEKLDAVDKDLKNAKEQLASVEREKIKAIEELNEAKRLADGVNEKLVEAINAQKRAEENLMMEKLRANELENAGNEAAQRREEELHKEIDSARSKHGFDASTLDAITWELERTKMELKEAVNAKDVATKEANDAMKSAEMNREKMELLSKEVVHLKALHESKLDDINTEEAGMVRKLEFEVRTLKLEIERAKAAEDKLAKMGAQVDQLQRDVTNARKGESEALELVDEWRKKTEMLKVDLQEAYQSEKSASDSLVTMMVQLEQSRSLLEDAESEISTLRGKMMSLEIELAKQTTDLEESDRQLDSARQDALNIGKTVELLKLEIQNLEQERLQAVNSEKEATLKVQSLMEENNKFNDEFRISKAEDEKTQKAMEDLAVALQAVSTEAGEKEERLLRTQAEIEESQAEIEQLNIALRNTEERYEVMLDEARYEVVCLKKIVERFEAEASNSSSEWDAKELSFINTIKKLEEEVASLKVEMSKMVDSQKFAKQETEEAKTGAPEVLTKLRHVESEAHSAYEAAKESKRKHLLLKEALLDRENELQSIAQENDNLRMQGAVTIEKSSTLLSHLTTKQFESDRENYLEKGNSEVPFKKLQDHHKEDHTQKEENRNGHKNHKVDTLKVIDNDLASERDHEVESIDDDPESDMDHASNTALTDETVSPNDKQQQQHQKKRPLLHKFGNLLKKGNH